ncbi:MAG: NAD-dependent epimerase/dehydratase family protein [Lentisphaeria bacterium]|nr:NAD-dependent epimerase/dehydratase family protein [Lentisphaeria bacterium]
MKVLLLGGSGWLGHHIAEILAAEKIDVTIVTRGKKQTFLSEVSSIPSITADKNDEAAMREILQTPYTHILDTVPSANSISHIHKYAFALRHYIHCSSTGGYTPLPFVPCNETAPYGGFSTGTGWDFKRKVDNMVLELFRNNGFPATVIRPCYITGPGMLPLDNFGGRRQDFMADIIAEKPLVLPENGQALLQPIHVKELAKSFFLAMMHPAAATGEVYNICLDHAVTLTRYLELNAQAFNKKAVITFDSVENILRQQGDKISETGLRFLACHMCFDISKARRDLEFHPACSPEDAIIGSALWAAEVTKAAK